LKGERFPYNELRIDENSIERISITPQENFKTNFRPRSRTRNQNKSLYLTATHGSVERPSFMQTPSSFGSQRKCGSGLETIGNRTSGGSTLASMGLNSRPISSLKK
jgi:hypothetical protein